MLVEAPAGLDVGLVHADHEALVQVLIELRPHRLDGRAEAVADVLATEAAREVDVGLAVDVGEPGARGPGHEKGRSANGAERPDRRIDPTGEDGPRPVEQVGRATHVSATAR